MTISNTIVVRSLPVRRFVRDNLLVLLLRTQTYIEWIADRHQLM